MATSYNGLNCPNKGTFFICDTINDPNKLTPFIRCCAADPCKVGGGCDQTTNLGSTSFDPEIWNRFPEQQCIEADGKWYECREREPGKFVGCCSSNPCAPEGCPQPNLPQARLADDPERKAAFISLASDRSLTATPTATLATSSIAASSAGDLQPPTGSAKLSASPSTNSNDNSTASSDQEARLPAESVAGIAIGCVVAGLLLGALAAFLLF